MELLQIQKIKSEQLNGNGGSNTQEAMAMLSFSQQTKGNARMIHLNAKTSQRDSNPNVSYFKRKEGKMICTYCGRDNHVKDKYYRIHGYPLGHRIYQPNVVANQATGLLGSNPQTQIIKNNGILAQSGGTNQHMENNNGGNQMGRCSITNF